MRKSVGRCLPENGGLPPARVNAGARYIRDRELVNQLAAKQSRIGTLGPNPRRNTVLAGSMHRVPITGAAIAAVPIAPRHAQPLPEAVSTTDGPQLATGRCCKKEARLGHMIAMETNRKQVDAFSELWRANYWPLQRYLARRLPADDVDEALAETFLVAWRRIDEVPQEHLPWMYGVARRIVSNQERSLRRRARLLAQLAAPRQPPPPEPAAGGPESVIAAFAMLSAGDQEVLRLIAWEELEPAACAVVLGCSRAAFDVRLHRARARFEGALAYLDAEAHIVSPAPTEGVE